MRSAHGPLVRLERREDACWTHWPGGSHLRCSRSRDESSLGEDEGWVYHSRSWNHRSKQGRWGEDDRPKTHFYLRPTRSRLRRSAATIWMCRAPRDWVPDCGWGVTDYHSLTGGGDRPGYLASVASVSREEKCRFVVKRMLGDMEGWEAAPATHPHEHGPCRTSTLSVSSGSL